MATRFSKELALREQATPAANPPSGTRWFYLKADGKLYTKDSGGVETAVDTGGSGGGAAVAPVQPAEPTGTVEGELWYDSDDDQFLVDVSYVQDNEPTGAAEGALWLDTDDPAAHTGADHTDLAPLDHTHDLSAYVLDADLTDGLATKADLTHTHGSILGVDGRGTVEAPLAFYEGKTRHAPRFQTGAELGLPRDFYALETIAPWSNDSGGGVHQVARGFGETWERYGTRAGGWGAWRVPGGGWQKIAEVSPSGSSNTVGNLSFLNIPTIYKRFRIRSPFLLCTGANTTMNLYLRFNSDSGSNYGWWAEYHTSTSPNGTQSTSGTYGYAAYSYFMVSSATSGINVLHNVLDMEIQNHGLGRATWESRQFGPNSTGANYTYGSRVEGIWNSLASITRIDLYTSGSYTWSSNSVVTLEGSLEI